MSPQDASPLTHSWPLFERHQRLDLGCYFDWNDTPVVDLRADAIALAQAAIGIWDCDLGDQTLTWSAGVYDLFGLPRGERIDRPTALSLYCESSRVAMERLRTHAIRHRRGFTLDVEIRPANGGHRWIRLAAAPVGTGRRPVRLQGFKRDVTEEYL